MKSEFRVLRCEKCGAMVQEIVPCTCDNCGIKCCGETMAKVIPNSQDGAKEKHVPVYEIDGDEIVVKVGEVIHPMDDDHYIMWIGISYENRVGRVCFAPGEEPKARFKYVPGAKIYAYCNKHGLYTKDVE